MIFSKNKYGLNIKIENEVFIKLIFIVVINFLILKKNLVYLKFPKIPYQYIKVGWMDYNIYALIIRIRIIILDPPLTLLNILR